MNKHDEKIHQVLVLLACLDENHKKVVRMRWGIEPLNIKNGSVVFEDDLAASTSENEIVNILCKELIPAYIHKEIKKNNKEKKWMGLLPLSTFTLALQAMVLFLNCGAYFPHKYLLGVIFPVFFFHITKDIF